MRRSFGFSTGINVMLSAAAFAALSACGSTPSPPPPPPSTDPNGKTPAYLAPGDLIPGSGSGQTDATIYLPGMRFPIEAAPAYLNSQVYRPGGSEGGGGGQCTATNYDYPWRDNFCETRSWEVFFCPTAMGHQGQDIRPATCERSKHWAVAAEAGQVTSIGTYSVTLVGNSGAVYRYLHLDMTKLEVSVGSTLSRGQRIGLVDDDFGTTSTTIHLHFDAKQNVTINGQQIFTFVPPYASLVNAYDRLIKGTP